jgi:hypothetical protein
MSALGQKQTCASQKVMSAYPRKRHQMRHMQCPLRANSGHRRNLIDHLVGTAEQRQHLAATFRVAFSLNTVTLLSRFITVIKGRRA